MAFVIFVRSHLILLFAVLLMAKAVASASGSGASAPAGGPAGSMDFAFSPAMSPSSNGGLGDADDSDLKRDSGVDQPRYISRAVLRKDRVPCDQRGASYYNCSSDQAINPYIRGCTKIASCPNLSFKNK